MAVRHAPFKAFAFSNKHDYNPSLVNYTPTSYAPSSPVWSVAIFAARETPKVLTKCVHAAITACSGRQAAINVLINGNAALAEEFGRTAKELDAKDVTLRVWSISAPDKAHTWNEYVYRIWEDAEIGFFIDGYAQVKPDALSAIARLLANRPEELGASGVPTSGRSAARIREQMLRSGGIHGNLFAISRGGIEKIRDAGFRLPLGIYRTGPLIGAALMFRLDPATYNWDPQRIAVEAGATWHVDAIEEITWNNIKTQFKRILRQAQGELENQAARKHMAVKKLPPQQLPLTAAEMIEQWLRNQPEQARALFRKRPLCHYAINKSGRRVIGRLRRTPLFWCTAIANTSRCRHSVATCLKDWAQARGDQTNGRRRGRRSTQAPPTPGRSG